jgi:DNA-binding NtrC family response regulator
MPPGDGIHRIGPPVLRVVSTDHERAPAAGDGKDVAMRVLVADDDHDVRATLVEFLTAQKVEVLEASNGLETLRHVTRCRLHAVELDAVVLDPRMPRLGGIDALRRIRAVDPGLPVIVVTATLEPALHRQAQALGAHEVLSKPADLSQLWALLLGNQTPPPEYEAALTEHGIASPEPTSAATVRILVVDDDADVRETGVEFLSARGYPMSAAPDAVTAIRILTAESVNIVLLDIAMPGLTATDALPMIRALAPRAMVIMVTANIDADLAKRSLAYGAFDYLVKPINWRHLAQGLRMAVEIHALSDERNASDSPEATESGG